MIDIYHIYSDLLDMADHHYHQYDYIEDAFMVGCFVENMTEKLYA